MVFNFEKIAPEMLEPFLEMVTKNRWSEIVAFIDKNAICSEKIGCCGSTDPLKIAINDYWPDIEAAKQSVSNKQTTVVNE